MIIPKNTLIFACSSQVEGIEMKQDWIYAPFMLTDFYPSRLKGVTFLHFSAENESFDYPSMMSSAHLLNWFIQQILLT